MSQQILVREETETTGTGDLTLSAVEGARRFSTAYSTGSSNNFYYYISHQGLTGDNLEWEYGTGYMSDATTLVRDSVIQSSNSNSIVDFSQGTKRVVSDISITENIGDINNATHLQVPTEKAVRDNFNEIVTISPGDATGYVEPGGFQLANVTINTKTSVELTTGGLITMTELSTGSDVQFFVPDNTQAEADSTDSLLKGTWQANTWYYLGLEGDSSGTNSPKLVYVQEGNSITDSDLDSGYDCFASLSQPRSGWVRTDGSSNLYEQNFSLSGGVLWGQNAIDAFGSLANDASPPENSAIEVDASGQIPPVKVNLSFQRIYINNSGLAEVSLGANELIGRQKCQIIITLGAMKESQQKTLKNVENQSFYYGYAHQPSNIDSFIIDTIAHFEVVGE